jgi:hypothetical protein
MPVAFRDSTGGSSPTLSLFTPQHACLFRLLCHAIWRRSFKYLHPYVDNRFSTVSPFNISLFYALWCLHVSVPELFPWKRLLFHSASLHRGRYPRWTSPAFKEYKVSLIYMSCVCFHPSHVHHTSSSSHNIVPLKSRRSATASTQRQDQTLGRIGSQA